MNQTEFLEIVVVRIGGSFVEVEPNHFVISHIPKEIAIKLIKKFGNKCLVEYRPENLYDRISARIEKITGRSSV